MPPLSRRTRECDWDGSGNLDSTAEIAAALADPGPGGVTDLGVGKLFECPVIPAR
jgi:hypothetical protein